jgi:hypothetical protein
MPPTSAAAPLATPNTSANTGCIHAIVVAVVLVWALITALIFQFGGWFAEQLSIGLIGPGFEWHAWPLLSLGHVVLLAVPVWPLAFFTRAPTFRALYQTWALAILAMGVWIPVRALPMLWNEAAALAQIILNVGLSVVVWGLARWRRKSSFVFNGGAAWLALAVGPLIVLPYAAWGALGSAGETLLNAGAGLTFGLFLGLLCDVFLFRPTPNLAAGIFGVIGVTLIAGAGFGFNGSQLILITILPPLALAAAALARLSDAEGAWLPLAVLFGLVTVAGLVFVDPEELSILLGGNEVSQWATYAAWASFALALGAAFPLGLLAWRRVRLPWLGALGLAVVAFIAGAGLYAIVGQPGFFGERLFVILKDQADVSAATAIGDRTERLTFVYETLRDHANQTQAPLRQMLDRVGVKYQPYYLVNALEVEGGLLVRVWLTFQPEVERLLDSPHLRPLPAPVPVSEGDLGAPSRPQWNLTSIGADRVWSEFGVAGQGIVVGQSDSGVDGQHPALKDQYRGRAEGHAYNWFDPWNHSASPTDIGGHGTHTLGSILGAGVGVAPEAQWFGCVNLARNLGNPGVYLDCMQFMLAPWPQGGNPLHAGDPARAAHVLNNSWGCPPLEGCDPTVLQPAVTALRDAGIFVVVSAGNSGLGGCGTVNAPLATYADVFSVGAIDEGNDLAEFSSRGPVTVDGSNRPKPDIVAPGVGVWSAFPNNTYAKHEGTSMAGPHVAGAVAVLWSANPALIGDIARTEQILRETARKDIGLANSECGRENLIGAGRLDVYAAVKEALQDK